MKARTARLIEHTLPGMLVRFTVVVADNGTPSLTATESFLVTVSESGEVGLGTLVVQAGQDGCIPITLDASEPISNANFPVFCPPGTFANLTIQPLVPALAARTEPRWCGRKQTAFRNAGLNSLD